MSAEGTYPRIDETRCTGCGLCVMVCRCGALVLYDRDVLLAHPERCDACGACEEICPESAVDCEFEIVWGEGQEPAAPANDGGDRV